jgi:hypothetical protein
MTAREWVSISGWILIGALCLAAALSERWWMRKVEHRAYWLGRRDADNWWIGIEGEVAKYRRLMWIEESKKS